MPYKRKRNGKIRWYGSIMRNGRKKEKVFDTRKEALTWEAQMSENLSTGRKTTLTASLGDWAIKYLDFAQRFSHKTYQEKRSVFQRLFTFIKPEARADRLTPQDILDFLQREFKARSGNSVNKDRKNLVAAYNWGIKYLGLPGPNPCLVDPFPEKRQPRYVPTEEDFWKVYEIAEPRDQVMLLAFLHLGARRGEVFNLLWSDIDFASSTIRLRTRKRQGGHHEEDLVKMTSELRKSLLWLWENRSHRSEHVFTVEGGFNFENQYEGQPYQYRQHFMRKLCAKAGVKPFGFHGIRHLTASILDKKGVELSIIQSVLRHKSATTTSRYLHSLRGVGEVLDAVMPTFGGKILELKKAAK